MGIVEHMNGQILNAHDKADRIIELLEQLESGISDVVDNTHAESMREKSQRIPVRQISDANGVATIALQVPQGIAWQLISASITGAAPGPGVGVRVYLGANDPVNLIHAENYPSAAYTFNFGSDEYVPQGQQVVVEYVGQGVGTAVTLNLKVQILREVGHPAFRE